MIKSPYPCLVKNVETGMYLPKGWAWHIKEGYIRWTSDIKKAKTYRNSAGAKNAMRGAHLSSQVELVEFHKEINK